MLRDTRSGRTVRHTLAIGRGSWEQISGLNSAFCISVVTTSLCRVLVSNFLRPRCVITILEVSWLHESGELFFSRRQPFHLDSSKITTTRRPRFRPWRTTSGEKRSAMSSSVGCRSPGRRSPGRQLHLAVRSVLRRFQSPPSASSPTVVRLTQVWSVVLRGSRRRFSRLPDSQMHPSSNTASSADSRKLSCGS